MTDRELIHYLIDRIRGQQIVRQGWLYKLLTEHVVNVSRDAPELCTNENMNKMLRKTQEAAYRYNDWTNK